MIANRVSRFAFTFILTLGFLGMVSDDAVADNRKCRFTVAYAPSNWEYFAPKSKKQLLESGKFKVCSAAIELLFERSFDEDYGPSEIGDDLRIAIVDDQTNRELFYDGDFVFYRGRKGRVSTALIGKVIRDIDSVHGRWLESLPKRPQ